jgi:hypothetical protein
LKPGREFTTAAGEIVCVSWSAELREYILSITPSPGPVVMPHGARLTEDEAATLVDVLGGAWRP